MIRDRWVLVIGVACAVRGAVIATLAATQVVAHNGWYWANKDQVEYYGMAHALVHGNVASIYTFLGYGALLAPLVVGTDFVLQAIPLIAVVQILLALPAAYLLYGAGVRLANRRVAAIGTALWLTTPLWLSTIWFPSYSRPFAMATFWSGLQISVDYASALLAIALLYVASGGRSDGSSRRGAIAGVIAGTALLVKPSNVVLLAACLLALLVWRRYRAAVVACAAAAVVFSAQLVLNWRLNGDFSKFEYSSAWPYGDARALASFTYAPRSIGKLLLLNYTGPLLGLAAVVALVVAWRRFPEMRWLVVLPAMGYVVFFSPLYYSISEFMLRFLTPALPAFCLAAGAALAGRRENVAVALVKPPRAGPVALAVAALGAGVALAVVVGVAPLVPDVPVVRSLRPRVGTESGGRLTVAWKRLDAHAELYYQLQRASAHDGQYRIVWAGLATRAVDRPGRGTWLYRLDVNPGYEPGGVPPVRVLATSPVVRVRIG